MRVKDDEKVVRIYQAAIKVINQDGFQGSSMSKIAELADEFDETQGVSDKIEQFKIINEKVVFPNSFVFWNCSK